jgi:hypothetical protein
MSVRATVALPNADCKTQLCVDSALQIAWWTWFVLLAMPFVVFLAVVWRLIDSEVAGNEPLAQMWFVTSMLMLAVGVPLAFFWRSRIFKGYWVGHVVSPKDYLVGMATIWISLEICGLFALAGCLVTGTLLPCILPALVAFMLFTPLWPSGQSMVRPVTNERDPHDWQEPR